MVRMLNGKVVVEVSEAKAKRLAAILGYKYLLDPAESVTEDLSPDVVFEVEPRPVAAPARRPGRPRKDATK